MIKMTSTMHSLSRNRVEGFLTLALALSIISLLNLVQVQGYMIFEEHTDEWSKIHKDGLCQRLEGKSASLLWAMSKSDLLQASIHPSDPKGYHKEWMSVLLQQISSSDLQKGLMHPPSARDLQRVMRKIEARMANATAPIVHVGVFGGSVTVGNGCPNIPDELKPFFKDKTEAPPYIGTVSCAWPTRLQVLCDHFLGKDVVHITNLGFGGAISSLSLPMLKYQLLGNEYLDKHGFDAIINGHSVNDNNFAMESRSQLELANFNTARQVAEAFYRQARTSRLCNIEDPPLVLYVNEYLGNWNELITGENLRHAAVQLVSEYYDFMYISYTHVFQRFVYQRSNETLFSPNWGTIQQPKVDVHPGMTSHVALVWVLAYSALQSVVDYCNHQQADGQEKEWNVDENNKESNSNPVRLIPDTSKDLVSGKSLSPLLNNASWTTISETWEQDTEEYQKQVHDYCALGENVTEQPCPFAFFSNSVGSTRTAASLNKYLAPYTLSKTGETTTGWQAADDLRGSGWVYKVGVVPAKGVGSKITLRVSNLAAPVRLLTIHSMKSYGPDWDTSIANFKLSVLDDDEKSSSASMLLYETSFNLTGWHNQKTSSWYVYEFELGYNTPAQAGKSIELEVTLLQGIKFKIMAILMCSR